MTTTRLMPLALALLCAFACQKTDQPTTTTPPAAEPAPTETTPTEPAPTDAPADDAAAPTDAPADDAAKPEEAAAKGDPACVSACVKERQSKQPGLGVPALQATCNSDCVSGAYKAPG